MAGSPQEQLLNTCWDLMRYAAIARPQVCVETGTYQGEGALSLAQQFRVVHTIELSEKWYKYSLQKLKPTKNIICHYGDSAEVLEKITSELNEATTFFLDAHFAGGDTARGKDEVPLLRELQVISRRSYCDLIIIDDIRLVGQVGTCGQEGSNIYPLMNYDWKDVTFERMASIINQENRTVWVKQSDVLIVFRNLSLNNAFRLKIIVSLTKIGSSFKTLMSRLLGSR